jgi:uncharacterized protein (DUF2252 family)
MRDGAMQTRMRRTGLHFPWAGWAAPADRRNIFDFLNESNEGRLARSGADPLWSDGASPFAFYGGAAAIMAADLAVTPTSGMRVQACGDAHLMSFGGGALSRSAI